jgi:hypothetical protein
VETMDEGVVANVHNNRHIELIVSRQAASEPRPTHPTG